MNPTIIINIILIVLLLVSGYRYALDISAHDAYKNRMEEDRKYKSSRPEQELSMEEAPRLNKYNRFLFFFSLTLVLGITGIILTN